MELKTVNKPEIKFKAGGITATVWSNKGEKGDYKTINLTRNYKDKENNWKSTTSMRINDLPKAKLVLEKAYEYALIPKPEEELSTML